MTKTTKLSNAKRVQMNDERDELIRQIKARGGKVIKNVTSTRDATYRAQYKAQSARFARMYNLNRKLDNTASN